MSPPPSRGAMEKRVSDRTAALVLDLLLRGWRVAEGEGSRPLEPSDICLLVDRHQQAEDLRRSLERRGLASRLLSQGDVFAGEGATLLQRLLDALAEPGSGARLRLLAASPCWAGVPSSWRAPAARSGITSPASWPASPSACPATDCSPPWGGCCAATSWPVSP
ncbi:hypothetical protein AAJV73_13905 [Cyanobium sp. BSA11S]|uniref:hypothetical protein n=1 Tax=Cyanobium sp. BSA11S TaxID=3108224 RepID=UPI003D81AF7C